MKKEDLGHKIFRAIYHYVLFFLLVAFLVTCSMMLFVSVLADTLQLNLTSENVTIAAKLTFGNVILLSVLFTVIDAIRRKLTTEKITEYIANAADKIVQGDFSVRIKAVNKMGVDENYNKIIHCFNMMAEELTGVETLRTDFIANVSHEMKTPLSVIQNYGTLLQMQDLDAEKRIEYAKGVAEGSRRLADMMANILKLNKLEKRSSSGTRDNGQKTIRSRYQNESEFDEIFGATQEISDKRLKSAKVRTNSSIATPSVAEKKSEVKDSAQTEKTEKREAKRFRDL